jgi:TusE/DsrC/DsvC family sulfur relay protein
MFKYNNKIYDVDSGGFLSNPGQWDKGFVEEMAVAAEITQGLSEKHWDVINYIRKVFRETGRCPSLYQTCRANCLNLRKLKSLFPTGYLRGACKLAGITYKEGYLKYSWLQAHTGETSPPVGEKTYEVDIRGFLVNPLDWDKDFALYKAYELKMPNGLSTRHWQIIEYIRSRFLKDNVIPTVYETCEANNIELMELEELFPDGYHRGAVKLAGLRIR